MGKKAQKQMKAALARAGSMTMLPSDIYKAQMPDLFKYSDDQPRDDHGRWGEGGGSSEPHATEGTTKPRWGIDSVADLKVGDRIYVSNGFSVRSRGNEVWVSPGQTGTVTGRSGRDWADLHLPNNGSKGYEQRISITDRYVENFRTPLESDR